LFHYPSSDRADPKYPQVVEVGACAVAPAPAWNSSRAEIHQRVGVPGDCLSFVVA